MTRLIFSFYFHESYNIYVIKGFIVEELRKLRQDDVIEEFLDFEWEVNENCGSGKKLTDDLLDKETKNATVNLMKCWQGDEKEIVS